MTARHYGLSACVLAVLLLAASLFGGSRAFGARQADAMLKAPPHAMPKAAPHVMNAWVRLPAVSGRPAGGFFLVHGMASADALVGVSSPKAQRIEMHSMKEEGGVMRMRAGTSFAVPAKGELRFEPGGSHLMIFGLAADVKPGDRLPLIFAFGSGAKVTLNAEARPAASTPVTAPAKAEPAHQH